MEILWTIFMVALGTLAVVVVISGIVGFVALMAMFWKVLPEFLRELRR